MTVICPDKAVDLIDEAGSRKHIRMVSIPHDVQDLEQQHQNLQHEKSDAFNARGFEKAAQLQMEILKVEEQLQKARSEWEGERS